MFNCKNIFKTPKQLLALFDFVLLLTFGLFGCSPKTPATVDYRPNLVIITIDSLRADFLGCYGNSVIKTPILDRESRKATVFTNAYTSAPYTVPALASLMTSLYPFQHQARNTIKTNSINNAVSKPSELIDIPLSKNIKTLATSFSKRGYHTYAVVGGFTTTKGFSGLNNGFEIYDDKMTGIKRKSSEITKNAIALLKKTDNKPFFLWLHYFEPHTPYNIDKHFHNYYTAKDFPVLMKQKDILNSTRLKNLLGKKLTPSSFSQGIASYAASISSVDHQIGLFKLACKSILNRHKNYFIVTSDHGESFTEHKEYFTHSEKLFNTTLHIPLIFALARKHNFVTQLIESSVGTIDLRPTIDDFFGYSQNRKQMMGISLKPLIKNIIKNSKRTIFAESKMLDAKSPKNRAFAIIQNQWKYIETNHNDQITKVLFNNNLDPLEETDVSVKNKDLTDQLNKKLISLKKLEMKSNVNTQPVKSQDEKTRDKLKSLGYLGN